MKSQDFISGGMSNTPPLTQDFNVHDVVTLIDYVDYTFTFRDEIEDLLPLLGVDKWRSNVTF